ncbi:MAG: glycosyltransferase family 39 protein [bacterium]
MNLSASEIIFFAAVLAGVAIRFLKLDQPLWLDEILDVNMALKSVFEIPKDLISEGRYGTSPPLFYVLLHFWIDIFGRSETAMHFLPACIGAAGIMMVWRAGLRFFGHAGGLAAAAFLAVHPFHIAHSQEIRPYGLLVLLSIVCTLSLFTAQKEGGLKNWIFFAFASLANMLTHNYAFFLFMFHLFWVVFSTARKETAFTRDGKNAGIAFFLILSGYALWLPGLLAQYQKDLSPDLLPPGLNGLGLTLCSLAGLGIKIGVEDSHDMLKLRMVPALVGYAVSAICAFRVIPKENKSIRDFLLLSLIVPIAMAFLVSFNKPIYDPCRHSIIALPFLCLLWGLAVQSMKAEIWRIAVFFFCFLISSSTIYGYFSMHKSYDRDIAGYIRAEIKPGYRIVIVPPDWIIPIAYYYPPAADLIVARPLLNSKNRPEGIITLEIGKLAFPESLTDNLRKVYRFSKQKTFGNFAIIKLYVPAATASAPACRPSGRCPPKS